MGLFLQADLQCVLPLKADETLYLCVCLLGRLQMQFMSLFSICACMTEFIFKFTWSDKHKYLTLSKGAMSDVKAHSNLYSIFRKTC